MCKRNTGVAIFSPYIYEGIILLFNIIILNVCPSVNMSAANNIEPVVEMETSEIATSVPYSMRYVSTTYYYYYYYYYYYCYY